MIKIFVRFNSILRLSLIHNIGRNSFSRKSITGFQPASRYITHYSDKTERTNAVQAGSLCYFHPVVGMSEDPNRGTTAERSHYF